MSKKSCSECGESLGDLQERYKALGGERPAFMVGCPKCRTSFQVRVHRRRCTDGVELKPTFELSKGMYARSLKGQGS